MSLLLDEIVEAARRCAEAQERQIACIVVTPSVKKGTYRQVLEMRIITWQSPVGVGEEKMETGRDMIFVSLEDWETLLRDKNLRVAPYLTDKYTFQGIPLHVSKY